MEKNSFKDYEELDERINGLEKMLGQLEKVAGIIDLMEKDSDENFAKGYDILIKNNVDSDYLDNLDPKDLVKKLEKIDSDEAKGIKDKLQKKEIERIAEILSNDIIEEKEKSEETKELEDLLEDISRFKDDKELKRYIKNSISFLRDCVKKENLKWSDERIIEEIKILEDEINYKLDGKLNVCSETTSVVGIYKLVKLQLDNIFKLARDRMAYYNLEQVEILHNNFGDNKDWYTEKIVGEKVKFDENIVLNEELKNEFEDGLNKLGEDETKKFLIAIKLEESKKYDDKMDYSEGIYNKDYTEVKSINPKGLGLGLAKWYNNVIGQYSKKLNNRTNEITNIKNKNWLVDLFKRIYFRIFKLSIFKNSRKELAKGGIFSGNRRKFADLERHTNILSTAIVQEKNLAGGLTTSSEGLNQLNRLKKFKDIKDACNYATKRDEKEAEIVKENLLKGYEKSLKEMISAPIKQKDLEIRKILDDVTKELGDSFKEENTLTKETNNDNSLENDTRSRRSSISSTKSDETVYEDEVNSMSKEIQKEKLDDVSKEPSDLFKEENTLTKETNNDNSLENDIRSRTSSISSTKSDETVYEDDVNSMSKETQKGNIENSEIRKKLDNIPKEPTNDDTIVEKNKVK